MKEAGKESALADFVFDDDDSFDFDSTSGKTIEKSPKTDVETVRKQVRDEADDDETEEPPTKIDKDNKPPKQASKQPPKEEREIEDDDFDFGDKEKKPDLKQPKEVQDGKGKEASEDKGKERQGSKDAKGDDEVDEDEGEEDVRQVQDLPEDFYTNLALDLKDRGVLTVEVDEEKKYTPEEFFELQEAEIAIRFEEVIDAFKEEFDEDGKDYLRWKKNGGSTKEFITQYLAPSFSLTSFDEDNASDVNRTIDYYLRTVEQLEDDELQDRKDYIKESGKEKGYAKNFYKKLEKTETERRDALQKQLEQKAVQEEADEKEFNADLIDTLANMKSVGSFSINENDKRSLPNYMIKPGVKIAKNRYIPKFQYDLKNILLASNKEMKRRLLILGKIVGNDFNLKDLEQHVETTVTKRAKTRIAGSPRTSTGTLSTRTRQLADMIDE